MIPNYPHLATRLFNVPLAIAPGKIEIIMAALTDRFGLARLFRANGEALALATRHAGQTRRVRRAGAERTRARRYRPARNPSAPLRSRRRVALQVRFSEATRFAVLFVRGSTYRGPR